MINKNNYRISSLLTILLVSFFALVISNQSIADINVGDIIVADNEFSSDNGAIFIVDGVTGDRRLLTDLGNSAQGPLGDEPDDLVIEPNGDVCVIENETGTDNVGVILRVNSTNGLRTLLSDLGDPAQGPIGGLPQHLGLFNNGDLYFADRDGPVDGGLYRVNKATGFRTVVTDLADIAQGPIAENGRDVAEGAGGTIFFITSSGSPTDNNRGLLFSVDPVTGFRTILSDLGDPVQGPIASPRWLATSPDGTRVYILTSTIIELLIEINPVTGNRTVLSDFQNPGQGPGSDAFGITVDESGTIFVNDNSSRVLLSIDPVTGFRTVVSNYSLSGQGYIPNFAQGLRVFPPHPAVPTLSEWGLIAMAGILGIVGFMVLRRRKVAA